MAARSGHRLQTRPAGRAGVGPQGSQDGSQGGGLFSQIMGQNSQAAAQVAQQDTQTQIAQSVQIQTSQGAIQAQSAQVAQQPPLTATNPVAQSAPTNTTIKPLEEPPE